MIKNVGSTDKVIRYIIAIIAFYIAYKGMVASPWDYVLYAVGAIMVLTAVLSWCPIFLVFGLNSCKVKK